MEHKLTFTSGGKPSEVNFIITGLHSNEVCFNRFSRRSLSDREPVLSLDLACHSFSVFDLLAMKKDKSSIASLFSFFNSDLSVVEYEKNCLFVLLRRHCFSIKLVGVSIGEVKQFLKNIPILVPSQASTRGLELQKSSSKIFLKVGHPRKNPLHKCLT